MTGDRFDDLARALAAPVSRRRALRIAGAALLGASAGAARPGRAQARRTTCANPGDVACRFPVPSLDGCCYTVSHGGGRKCCEGADASQCVSVSEICCFDHQSGGFGTCPPSLPQCCYESGGVQCCPSTSKCCPTSASHCCEPPYLCTPKGCAECSTGENKCGGKKCCGSNQYCASILYGGLCCRKGATKLCVAPRSGSKGPATCCTDNERCCSAKGKAACCGPKQKCHAGTCKCPKSAPKKCGSQCCKKDRLCCGTEEDKGKSCCEAGDKCCGHTCCPKDRACCTGSTLSPHCCAAGEVCAPKPGAAEMSGAPCCPKLRLAHAQGKAVCCPVGTIEIGGNCCPPDQLGCCDFPCADKQICVRGKCVPA